MLNNLEKQLQQLLSSDSPAFGAILFNLLHHKIATFGAKKYFPANRVYLTKVSRNKPKPFIQAKCMEWDSTIHHKFEIPEKELTSCHGNRFNNFCH